MNTRIRTRLLTRALPVASALWLVATSAAAADSPRMELLAAAGSGQAVQVHGRHDGRNDGRYDHDRRDHRGRDDRRGHAPNHRRHPGPGYRRDHGYGYDHGHGNAIRELAHYYASTAVRQAEEARALGFRSDHPRWRTGYQRHYRWALQASPARIDEEIRRRAEKLRELRTWGYGRAPWDRHGRRGYHPH